MPITRRRAVGAVRPDGRAISLGLHEDETSLAINTIVRAEIGIRGPFCHSQANCTAALRPLAEGFLPAAASWPTLRPLDEADASFAQLIDAPADIATIVLRP